MEIDVVAANIAAIDLCTTYSHCLLLIQFTILYQNYFITNAFIKQFKIRHIIIVISILVIHIIKHTQKKYKHIYLLQL